MLRRWCGACGKLTWPPTTSTEPSGRTTLLQKARLAAIGARGCTCAGVPYAPIVTCVHGAPSMSYMIYVTDVAVHNLIRQPLAFM